jgi:hypothetical protein
VDFLAILLIGLVTELPEADIARKTTVIKKYVWI